MQLLIMQIMMLVSYAASHYADYDVGKLCSFALYTL